MTQALQQEHHYSPTRRAHLIKFDKEIINWALAIQAVPPSRYPDAVRGWFACCDIAAAVHCADSTVGSRLRQAVSVGLITKARRFYAGRYYYKIERLAPPSQLQLLEGGL